MRRTRLFTALAVCVAILVAAVALLRSLREERKEERRKPLAITPPPEPTKGAARHRRRPRPAALHLDLCLNWGSGALVAGTPLRLEVWLTSPLGVRAQWLERQISRYRAKEKPTPTQQRLLADWQAELDDLRAGEIVLRSDTRPVAKWVTFELLAGQDYAPLPWTVEATSVPEGKELSVGTTPQILTYCVPPDAAKAIPLGEHRVRARLAPGLAPQAEAGMVSEPQRIHILDEQKANRYVRLNSLHRAGLHYLASREPAKAQEQARRMLAIDPERVAAHMLLGDVHEGRGNLEKAYLAYVTASGIVRRKRPNDRPPRLLIRRKNEIRAKLAAKLVKLKTRKP